MTGFRWLLWSRGRAARVGAVGVVVLSLLGTVALFSLVAKFPSPPTVPPPPVTASSPAPVAPGPVGSAPSGPPAPVPGEVEARAAVEGFMLAWLRHPGDEKQWVTRLTPYGTTEWVNLVRGADPGRLPKGAVREVRTVEAPREGSAVYQVVLTTGEQLRVTVTEDRKRARWLVGDVRPWGA